MENLSKPLLKEAISEYDSFKESQTEVEFVKGKFFDRIHKIIPRYFNWEEDKENTILVYKELLQEIKKRYPNDLFKGAVIFESLLKKSNKCPDGEDYKTLNGIFTDSNGPFINKYPDFEMVTRSC